MFRKARYVYELYRTGSFTKAAKELFISQPCLSAAIKQLEVELGAPLFERKGGTVIPTELGLSYIGTAEKIIALEDSFSAHLTNRKEMLCDTIRVGGSNYVSSYILPRIISGFTKLFPCVSVSMTEASSTELTRLLESGKIDIVVDSFDKEPSNVTYHALIEENILLAVPSSAEINRKISESAFSPVDVYEKRAELPSPLSISNFQDERFVLLKHGNSMYEHAVSIFKRGGFTPKVSFFLDQLSTSLALVAQGGGLCFVTDTVFRYHRYNEPVLLYRTIESGKRTLGLSHKSSGSISEALKKFIEVADEVIS